MADIYFISLILGSLGLMFLVFIGNYSMFSWGEIVQIWVSNIDNNKVRVNIDSFARDQLFDWGINRQNKGKIINQLKSYGEI